MKVKERQEAINLRKRGLTYREIQKDIPVSKGSLSNWLKEIELTPKQIKRIDYKNQLIKKKFIEYNKRRKREAKKRRNSIIEAAKREINKISKRELKLLGIALYWAEGSKCERRHTLVFSNSNPYMSSLMMRWFRDICKVPECKFRLKVQAYGKDKIPQYEKFWSPLTGIPMSQFIKPYVKVSKYSKLRRGNILPYGTLHIRISNIDLQSKISGWIKALEALSSSLAEDISFSS